MANTDFRNDAEYQKTQEQIKSKTRSANRWNSVSGLGTMGMLGIGTLALLDLTVPFIGFPLTLAAIATVGTFAIYSGAKSNKAKKDSEALKEQSNADIAAYYASKAVAQQQETSAEVGTGTKFRDMVTTGRNQQTVRQA